jgi:hypothetical protein
MAPSISAKWTPEAFFVLQRLGDFSIMGAIYLGEGQAI